MRIDREDSYSSKGHFGLRPSFHEANPSEDESKYSQNTFWNYNVGNFSETGTKVSLDLSLTAPFANSEQDIRDYLRTTPLAERLDSEPVLELASTWLDTCISNHPKCNTRTGTADFKLPTRLLELGTPTPGHIRLRKTSESDLKGPYMTLSHCWGSAKFLTLTAETLEQLLTGLPLSSLPQTFQDAVKVSRRLGAQFLWIDSLCIFQDSEEDWRREASCMGDVYRNSLCNIAATSAPNGSTGFFANRNTNFPDPKVIPVGSRGYHTDFYHIYSNKYQETTLESEQPLLSRGWVVQERILPARVLHFGTRQAFWECCTMTACETFPAGLPASLSNHENILKLNDPFGSQGDDGSSAAESISKVEQNIYRYWAKVIQVYSSCNLTFQKDKLVAISGVAKALSGLFPNGTKYLAGLWAPNIVQDLLRVRNSKTPTVRPTSYRAPSWSWASIDGGVACNDLTRFSFDVTMIESKIVLAGDDTFGQVKSGLIRLYGPLFPLEVLSESSARYAALINGKNVDIFQSVDIFQQQFSFDMPMYDPVGEKLHIMSFTCIDPYVAGRIRPIVIGLVLQPTGNETGQFRRLGYVILQEDLAVAAGAPNWTTVPSQDWFEYESFDGISKYTISIV
jgi:hypothetical protein